MVLLKLSASLILLPAALMPAQETARVLTLSETSNVPAKEIERALQKVCPGVRLAVGSIRADYKIDAQKTTTRPGLGIEHVNQFEITITDSDGNLVSGATEGSLNQSVKEMCHAVKAPVIIEVVDTKTLTQSTDVRGQGPGVAAAAVNSVTGRRTHTDESTIYVIVNGEHALLDCYERRAGCTTVGPGKYYGELKGDGVWISYKMPITHQTVRNHYKLAGGW